MHNYEPLFEPGTAEHLEKALLKEFKGRGTSDINAISEIQQRMAGSMHTVSLEQFLSKLAKYSPDVVSFVQGYLGGADEVPLYAFTDSKEISTAENMKRDALGRFLVPVTVLRPFPS